MLCVRVCVLQITFDNITSMVPEPKIKSDVKVDLVFQFEL